MICGKGIVVGDENEEDRGGSRRVEDVARRISTSRVEGVMSIASSRGVLLVLNISKLMISRVGCCDVTLWI